MRRTTLGLGCAVLLMFGCAEDADTGGEDPGGGEPAAASWVAELPTGEAATGVPSGEMRSIEATPAAAQAGQAVYGANCVPCHGAEGEGRLGIGPKLNSETFLAAASDGYLLRTIGRGRVGTTMPGWGTTLDRGEVESVIAYMRSWQEVEPAELDEEPCEGDAEAGAERFREICAACHGLSGGGYQETSNGTGIGRSAFLADVSNGYLRYIVEHGKSNTPMRPFGRPEATAVANLTDQDVENVIAHLRASAW
ncbi:MAG: c-type cytochrome [Sandaracinaceae bacterium]|nr:c-type cytochrome [Sandaracinaceae bacterium]